jgi:hypothetical protein
MYLVAKVEESGVQHLRIFALDIRTGENVHEPTDIAGSFPGTALPESQSSTLTFDTVPPNGARHLLLHDGSSTSPASAHCAISAVARLALCVSGAHGGAEAVFVSRRMARWRRQSGAGLSADNSGVYVVFGNGTYEDGTVKPQSGYGQTIARFKLRETSSTFRIGSLPSTWTSRTSKTPTWRAPRSWSPTRTWSSP